MSYLRYLDIKGLLDCCERIVVVLSLSVITMDTPFAALKDLSFETTTPEKNAIGLIRTVSFGGTVFAFDSAVTQLTPEKQRLRKRQRQGEQEPER